MWAVSTYPNHDVTTSATTFQCAMPQLGHNHELAILLVSLCIFLVLVLDAIVVDLFDAHELTVIAFGSHHTAMVKCVHYWKYDKTVAHL